MPHRLTLLPDQPQQVGDLQLRVVEIVEKRLTDGSGEMRVLVQARRGDAQRMLEFTSAALPLEWAGLRFRYLGGWRSEVQLEIEPAAD